MRDVSSGFIPYLNVLGTRIAAINTARVIGLVDGWLHDSATGHYVCVTGVHGVMEGFRNPVIQKAHNSADLCVPDGMPLTWIGRAKGNREMRRVYGPDLMLEILALSSRQGYSNYFYGGGEGVALELKERMEPRFPGLQVVGTYCPPFRPLEPAERDDVISDFARTAPDVTWVGLSTPKQELFMADFHDKLNTKVMFGVGAAFDFHTGRVRQAPRWVMAAGLEWLFRLCMEPRRLGPRYLRNNPAFIWHNTLQQLGLKRYPLD